MMKMPETPTPDDDQAISCYFTLARPLAKLKRLLTSIQQAANNITPQVSEGVQVLILHLVNNVITPEQFQTDIQNLIKCPLKQFVVPFIVSTLPLLQDEIYHCDKSPSVLAERTSPKLEAAQTVSVETRTKRALSDSPISSPFKKPCYSDIKHRRVIRRAIQISQCLSVLGKELEAELRVLDEHKMSDLEDAELNKELNILSSFLSSLTGETSGPILEQVKELLRSKEEDCIRKTYTLLNTQSDNKTTSCWNCGRKALESCSGCSIAKYCGLFCQHKHWTVHHTTCKPPDTSTEAEVSVTD